VRLSAGRHRGNRPTGSAVVGWGCGAAGDARDDEAVAETSEPTPARPRFRGVCDWYVACSSESVVAVTEHAMRTLLAELLEEPAGLTRAERRFYTTGTVGCIAAAFVHAAFVVLFGWLGIRHMVIYNVASVVFWLGIIPLHRRRAFALLLTLEASEIVLHAVLATLALGWAAGFQFYVLLIVGFAFLTPMSMPHKLGLSALSIAIHAGLFLYVRANPPPPIGGGVIDVLGVINLVGTSLVLCVIGFVYYLMAERVEGALDRERQRSEQLLLNILPAPIAARLKAGEEPIADRLEDVTIMFCDIVDFTPLAQRIPPDDVVELLNRIFCRIDELVDRYGLEKIKTIGDAYMVAAGVPEPRDDHAEAVARLALDLVRVVEQTGTGLRMRIGINSGPVVAGVIGRRKFSYDLWGDSVNLAARMESHGVPGRVQVSEATKDLLQARFEVEERGVIEVKGKGNMRTWFVTAERPPQTTTAPKMLADAVGLSDADAREVARARAS
jgi:class 3 adenylate cyclase